MKSVFRKLLCLLFLLFFGLDIMQDMSPCQEHLGGSAASCHVCPCGTHLFSPVSVGTAPNTNWTGRITCEETSHVPLLPKSFFHPPPSAA